MLTDGNMRFFFKLAWHVIAAKEEDTAFSPDVLQRAHKDVDGIVWKKCTKVVNKV